MPSQPKESPIAGAWCYMLECADGRFYVGTTRLELVQERVGQHNAGVDPKAFTIRRRPVRCVWAEHFGEVVDAVAAERRLKGWSRRKKMAVIEGRWEDLPGLSRRGKA